MRVNHEGVREVLSTVGPLTSREIADFFPGSSYRCVGAVLHSLRTLATRQVYISKWDRESGHGRAHLQPVYALGNKPDAPKPRGLTNAEKCARHRRKWALPKVANSVFNLASQL